MPERFVPETICSDAEGDAAPSFANLFDTHRPTVARVSWRLLGNREDAQDAAQEVWMRAVRAAHRLDPGRDPKPWLIRITVNVCRTLLRRRRRVHEPLDELPLAVVADRLALAPEQERRLTAVEAAATLHTALARLPRRERTAIVLRDLEGLTTREVARALGCTQGTVRSHLSRGRLRLAGVLRTDSAGAGDRRLESAAGAVEDTEEGP